MNQYVEKSPSYFSSNRRDLYRIISRLGTFESGLDIGCGQGRLLCDLKKSGYVRKITGVEAMRPPDDYGCFDAFFCLTAEEVVFGADALGVFDLIVLADVLEHLIDPWSLVQEIVKRCLAPRGYLIISVPNFRNIFTIGGILIKGSFKYRTDGVLDKSHLRFFTVKDIVRLLDVKELDLELLVPNFKNKGFLPFGTNRLRILNILTLNLFPFWIGDQITAVVRKRNIDI